MRGWNVCVQGKANMEMATSKYNTALLLAVNNGQTPLIELLVNQGNENYILIHDLLFLPISHFALWAAPRAQWGSWTKPLVRGQYKKA